MLGIVLVDHGFGHVRDVATWSFVNETMILLLDRLVHTCIALASHIDLVVADTEDSLRCAHLSFTHQSIVNTGTDLKVSEEVNELGCRLFLVCRRRFAPREAYADRILDPQHVGQVDPGVGVDAR